jgi:ABC-2 type transport system ATP-binding protein
MSEPAIKATQLQKTYRIPVREPGVGNALRALFHPAHQDVPAVTGIDFEIARGEVVGFIGPNGAGKTTTLKMLSGLLVPTGGEVRVEGCIPHRREPDWLRTIALVMGNKSQLNLSLTVMDSFDITREIYGVAKPSFKVRLDELTELLEIGELLPKMARNLSLGERAKCEFANALLYQPAVLFLDEPTLGMDVSIQIRLRAFLKEYQRRHGTTVLLTSHYMADITSLCERTLLIHEGRLMYDGPLDALSRRLSPFKLIKVTFREEPAGLPALADNQQDLEVVEQEGITYTLRVRNEAVPTLTPRLLTEFATLDFTIENPPVEAVIDQVYREGVSA